MSGTLADIRKKIDALDNKIHDALMQRADLVAEIAKVKKSKKLPYVQPAREAQAMRRIIGRHQGALPEAAVGRIWRELIGAATILQIAMKVCVCVEDEEFITWDLAKSYFGSVVQMQRYSAASVALAAARDEDYNFAVLPWPQDEDEFPWWVSLFAQDTDLRIVCALPFGGFAAEFEDSRRRALVVGKAPFAESGDDHSFLVLKVDPHVSRGRIVERLQALEIEPLSIVTKAAPHDPSMHLHLIEVRGFIDSDDERLIDYAQQFEEFGGECRAIGGYPVPPIYAENKKIRPQEPVLTAPPVRAKD
jgi:chorismate mutase-like protein